MQILFWAVCGLLAGWFAGRFTLSEGRDRVMDVVMGVAGGVGGGLLLDLVTFHVGGRMVYTGFAAVVGAASLTIISRYAIGRQEFSSTR